MNELEQTLQKILERSLEVAEQTGQFVINQAPEILEQFFKWHVAKHSMGILLGIAMLILVYWICKKIEQTDWDDKIFPQVMLTVIVGGVGIGLSIGNLYWVIYILIAPKIYLIEYFIK